VDQFVGQEVGLSRWVTVAQSRIDEFTECTGYRQWIHVDVERMRRESAFGGTIAHGHLTLSLATSLSTEVGAIPKDASAAVNYGMGNVRFITPVKAGARVRNRIVLLTVERRAGGVLITLGNTIEIEGETKPALVAESRTLLMAA